jgi:TolB protein
MPTGTQIVFSDGLSVKETDLAGNAHTLFSVPPAPGVIYPIGTVSVSPDGQRVALAIETTTTPYAITQIFVANIDGSNLRQLTQAPAEGSSPHWSPDGKLVIYDGSVGSGSILVVSPNGGASTVIKAATPDPNFDAFSDPSYSPDGTQIVFDSVVNHIERMNADGSGAQPIPTHAGYNPNWGPLPTCSVLAANVAAFALFHVNACVGASAG